jgi:hypothetical protein
MDDRLYFLLSLVAATVAVWLVGSGTLDADVLVVTTLLLAAALFAVGVRSARRDA